MRTLIAVAVPPGFTAVLPLVGISGDEAGVLAFLVLMGCGWFGGPIAALLAPFVLHSSIRLLQHGPAEMFDFSRKQVMDIGALSALSFTVGWAGQYHRRARDANRRVTAKVESQARALSLAQVVFCDIHGRISGWNDGAQSLYGWTSAEAEGRLIHELLRTEFPVERQQIVRTLLEAGQWQGEVVQVHHDGGRLVVACHWILHREEEGGEPTIVHISNDVTEVHRAREALRETDRRKDEFLAMLAHELRNPLAPIRSGLDVLQLGDFDEETIDLMSDQVDHLARLVDDLLDVSRIKRGKVQLRKETVDLAVIARRAAAAAKSFVDAQGHHLGLSVPDDPVWVHADVVRMVQVVGNLVHNAAKYTDPGGWIQLEVRRYNGSGEIAVRDNGIGIPEEAMPWVFDLFTQADQSLDRSRGGLGIGLTVVRSLVELHAGEVSAHSAGEGQGSAFTVRLPIHEPHAAAPLPAAPVRSDSQRVLIIDDNASAASMLRLLLNRMGLESVETAGDGESGLRVAEAFRPDVIFLDLGLPQLSGYDVARRLRAQSRHQSTRVVALTGYGSEEDRLRAIESGCDDHCLKPISLDHLKRILAGRGA